MTYKFYTLDVFTNRPFCGNPLAVFPHAEGLSSETMQKIAMEFNFSETVFIFPSTNQEANYKLRIFTPGGEIPFAGHPTIGTAFLLGYLGMIPIEKDVTDIVLEEGVGNIPVTIYSQYKEPTEAELKANLPEFFDEIPPPESLAEVLSLSKTDFHPHFPPQAVSCGLPFLIIPLNSLSALTRAKINLSAWHETLSNYIAPHVYVCFPVKYTHWRVRMFAPALNIVEDPATGSAAAAFSAYLANLQPFADGVCQYFIEQGIEIHRPSQISSIVTKHNQKITEIKVKGECVVITEGFQIEI